MKNILITSAGRRVELVQSFQQEVADAGLKIAVHASDLHPERSAACRIADASVKMPRVRAPDYPEILLDYCRANEIGMIVPMIDTELLTLASTRDLFEREGVTSIISSPSLVEQCRNKFRTVDLFQSIGLDAPSVLAPASLTFPCFVRPIDGSSSVGARKIHGSDDVTESLLADERMIFSEYVDKSHDEYTVDCYFDRHGRIRTWVPRLRLEVRAGEISKGVTRRNFVHRRLGEILPRLQGARGCITLQLFARESDERLLGIEINPRFGGGYPLSYAAGASFPRFLIEEYLLGRELTQVPEWECDLLMLRYDAKVLVGSFA